MLASTQKKIIAISSSNGTLTGEASPAPGAIFYRMSKAALNREMQIVAASTRKDGVTVVMFNPGRRSQSARSIWTVSAGMLKTSFTVGNMIKTIDKLKPGRYRQVPALRRRYRAVVRPRTSRKPQTLALAACTRS